MKKQKEPKKRAENYEPPLHIEGDFDNLIKAIVKEPKIKD
jgi:hypothetical protein